MALSLIPQQRPEQHMHILSIEEILILGENKGMNQPDLEHYFSPTRKEMFIKDYLHYLNTSLLEVKHGNLDLDLYLTLVLSFQFTAPLLQIHAEKELGIFYRSLEQKYKVNDLDINLRFRREKEDDELHEPKDPKEQMINEEEALSSFRQELDNSYQGRRDVKETVQKRLKQDGIEAIMRWQHTKAIPELAEAFGRSIVIPSFFSFTDKKLINFYRSTAERIVYEVAVPDFNGEEEMSD